MKIIIPLIASLFLFFFWPESNSKIVNTSDYDHFLLEDGSHEIESATAEYEFWKNKLEGAPHQYPFMVKMADAQNLLFNRTGQVSHLNEATKLLVKANDIVNGKESSILRKLAKNYISQHRFTESLSALLEAQKLGTQLEQTEKMLFDVLMELGQYSDAYNYLENMNSGNSFDYLIRKSKWEDHVGNLDGAIHYMERALDGVQLKNDQILLQWTVTNLADYYGHAGNIEKSYQHYLQALALDPSDAYSKKGIAWVAFSHDRNIEEAQRIISKIANQRNTPDLLLLNAEMAEYLNNSVAKSEWTNAFLTEISSEQYYGHMYNKYLIGILSESPSSIQEALKLASFEVDMRPIAQSYALLSLVQFRMGDKATAMCTLEDHVINKTYEPEPLLIAAQVMNEESASKELEYVKSELSSSIYELGPVAERLINSM